MNLDNIITATDLSEELGVSYAKAQTILKEMGEDKGVKKGGVTFYDRKEVKTYLRSKNMTLLAFLDCIPADKAAHATAAKFSN